MRPEASRWLGTAGRQEFAWKVELPWDENTQANDLARLATSEGAASMDRNCSHQVSDSTGWLTYNQPKGGRHDKVNNFSRKASSNTSGRHSGGNLHDPIIKYIKTGALPENKVQAHQLQNSEVCYHRQPTIQEEFLSINSQVCNSRARKIILKDIHEWVCSNHTGGITCLSNDQAGWGYF